VYQNQRPKQFDTITWAIGLIVILVVAAVIVLATHHSGGTQPGGISNTLNTVSSSL